MSVRGESVQGVAVVGRCALPVQKIHQAAVVFGRDVDQAATGVPACGMGECECAVDPAVGFKLTLDLHPVSDQEGEFSGNLEPLRGQVHEGAQAGGPVAVHEAAPVDGDAKVMTWVGHGMPFVMTPYG